MDLVPVGATLRRDGKVGDRSHTDAADGDAAVEVDQLVADYAAAAHPLERGGLDHPVPERDRAELRGRERVGELR